MSRGSGGFIYDMALPDGYIPGVDVARLVKIGTTGEIGLGHKKLVEADSRELLVCNAFGTYYAISPICPDEDGPLQDGSLVGEVVTCPVHGYDFNVRTGECPFGSELGVATFPVKIHGGDLYVELS